MEENIERKVLKAMIGLWLEQRLKAFTHDKNKISKALGVDSRKARTIILSLLEETAEALRSPNIKQKSDDVIAKVIVGTWIEGELVNLTREIGRISKTMGIRGHEVKDFIVSMLGEISEALKEIYDSHYKSDINRHDESESS